PPTPLPSPLSLHDALPISGVHLSALSSTLSAAVFSWTQETRLVRRFPAPALRPRCGAAAAGSGCCCRASCGSAERSFNQVLGARSEEHTSELQSRFDLVCR